MTWFSDSLEIMSTNLFWTLFLLLLGIIIVEIFLLYHKLDPWITYWIMRSDTRKQLMDLEDRYTYTKKDSSIISINNWGKMCSCHFSQDISKWISSWVQYLSEDAQFCNSYIRHEKILLGPDHVQLNRLNTLHQSQPAEPSMDLDWTEKARQHSAGRSAHNLSQKITTPSCGDNQSNEVKPTTKFIAIS